MVKNLKKIIPKATKATTTIKMSTTMKMTTTSKIMGMIMTKKTEVKMNKKKRKMRMKMQEKMEPNAHTLATCTKKRKI